MWPLATVGAALLLVSCAPGVAAQSCEVKFAKPGCRMSWDDALGYAKMQNGRLLLVEEAKRFVASCPDGFYDTLHTQSDANGLEQSLLTWVALGVSGKVIQLPFIIFH